MDCSESLINTRIDVNYLRDGLLIEKNTSMVRTFFQKTHLFTCSLLEYE